MRQIESRHTPIAEPLSKPQETKDKTPEDEDSAT